MTHYMRKKEEIEKIAELFARFRAEVENLNSLNLYDINIHAENVIIPILNIVYGLNLVNINNEVKNSSAIDLVDTDNRIAIQVTSTATGEKIKHTIDEFIKGRRFEEYDNLLIYIITEKQKKYSDSTFAIAHNNELEFSEKHILDISFKPLDNRDEPLNKLIEIGTVEEYSINEFADISLKYEEALLHLINRSIEELASYKNIQWVGKDRFFRFKPIGVPRERKITWKNKKTATRTVVAEIWNNEKKQILYFRQLSFRIQSFRSDEKWFISITPGWSFTYDGYSSCKQESQLIAQKKNLETNSAVYQHFMFISFCLSNKLEDNESEYKYISFSSPFDLKLNYTPQHGY